MKLYTTIVLVLALLLTLGLAACQGTFSSSAVDAADAPATAVEAAVEESFQTENTAEIDISFTSPETHYVVLENDRFMPSDLEIKAGDIVEWINEDEDKHSVIFTDGSFDEVLPTGAVLGMTFTEAGEYWYVNQLEAGMRGRIVVR